MQQTSVGAIIVLPFSGFAIKSNSLGGEISYKNAPPTSHTGKLVFQTKVTWEVPPT